LRVSFLKLLELLRVPSARVCDWGVDGGLVFVGTVKRRQLCKHK